MSMHLGDSREPLSSSGNESVRDFWRNRSVLERRLSVVIVVLVLIIISLIVTVGVLADRTSSSEASVANYGCTNPSCLRDGISILESMNTSVDPCDDFYLYACGNYIANNEIMEGNYQYTPLLNLEPQNTEVILDILKTKVLGKVETALDKARKMFEACINEHAYEDATPILNLIQKYGGWLALDGKRETLMSWDKVIERMGIGSALGGSDGILQLTIMPSLKNNSQYLIYLDNPGIKQLLNTYNETATAYVIKFIFTKLKAKNQAEEFLNEVAQGIIKVNIFIQMLIGQIQPKGVNFTDLYMFSTIDEFQNYTNCKFKWEDYFKHLLNTTVPEVEVKGSMPIVVKSSDYFKNLCKFFGGSNTGPGITPMEAMDYVTFQLIRQLITLTNVRKGLNRQERMVLYPKKGMFPLSLGKKNLIPIPENERACVDLVTQAFSYAIAKEFAEIRSVQKNTLLAQEITEEIIDVVKHRLQNIDWMDEATRKEAFNKINSMRKFYVYPDWVANDTKLQKFYEKINITENHFRNSIYIIKTIRTEELKTLVKPPEVALWEVTPTTVNAAYSPQDNSINILLGILQPPIINSERLKAMNYASLGAIIGHEITHAFDLTGRQFDEKGNLRNWWTDTVSEVFQRKAECLITQYSRFQLNSSYISDIQPIQINGSLAVSENIADNGGVQQAFTAFKKKMEVEGEEKPPFFLKDYTIDQIFFLSYAQLRCAKYLPLFAKSLAESDHSPNPFRVLGPLQNFPEFAKAFSCPLHSNMKPDRELCKLW